LELAPRKRLHRAPGDMADAELGERRAPLLGVAAWSEGEEALGGERHGAIDGEALGHIADAQARTAMHVPGGGLHEPQEDAHQRRLARAVGADERDELAPMHRE